MKYALAFALCLSCGLTQKEAEDVGKVSATILCVLEHEELDDAALNAICDGLKSLTPEQKATITRHALVKRTACKPEKAP